MGSFEGSRTPKLGNVQTTRITAVVRGLALAPKLMHACMHACWDAFPFVS